jgi:hypothetical protein
LSTTRLIGLVPAVTGLRACDRDPNAGKTVSERDEPQTATSSFNNSQTSPLHGETGDVAPRIIIVAVIAKQSRQEGSGQGCFDSLEFLSDVLGDSLDELPFLLQGLLWT